MRVSVLGQGKLGNPMTCIFADAGHEVTGIDSNKEIVSMLSKGKCHIVEPHLQDYLSRQNGRLQFSSSVKSIRESDLVFILVPTPSKPSGEFSNDFILSAIRSMASELQSRQTYFILVIVSTIMPGTMRNVIVPEVERLIGRKIGGTWGAAYVPEFVALGNVIKGMLKPDALLIGQSDETAGRMVEAFELSVVKNNPPIVRTTFESAEIAKIALNSYITMKISFANMMAQICDTQGGNVEDVMRFLGYDSRINPKYLKAGTSYGGPCFVRDDKALAVCVPYDADIPVAIDEFNKGHIEYIAGAIHKLVLSHSVITILGASYKPNTPVTEESASLAIAAQLRDYGHTVRVFDPQAKCDGTLEYCLDGSNMAVLATPWEEFRLIKPYTFLRLMETPRVYDCWRFYGKDYFKDTGVEYNALGIA